MSGESAAPQIKRYVIQVNPGRPRLSIDLTLCKKDWVPDARNKRLKFTARIYAFKGGKWVYPGEKRKITFKFKEGDDGKKKVSKEKGICMNFPKKDDSNENPDLFFAEDGDNKDNYKLEEDDTSGNPCPKKIIDDDDNLEHEHHYLKATTKEAVTEAIIEVRCEDYGAFGTIQAEAEDCETLKPRESNAGCSQELGDNDVKIPRDDNGNNIADSAAQDKNKDGTKALPDKDEDDTPTGNGVEGDGLTNYEEYRGFIIGGGGKAKKEHKRTSITQKDLFIYIEHSELSAHLSYFNKTGLKARILYDPDLYDGNTSRVINFNKTSATKAEQHGLWLRKEVHARARGVTYFSKKPYIPGNCTKVTIMVQTIKNEGLANMLDRVVAHELGHAIGIEHHGDGTGPNPSHHVCGGINYYNRNGLETSGNINCVMRYTGFANGWCHDTPHHTHPAENPSIVGNIYCNSDTGTGINNPGVGHFRNNATKGDCQSQIRVKDWEE